MTVLAVVQTWNRNDPIRGFIVPWMEALATRVDRVLILTLEQREQPRPSNIFVCSLGKESGAKRLGYLAAWHQAWRDILRGQPPDVVFTHMSPIFTVLSAPYTRRRRIPIVTWFAHRHVSPTLKLAHRLSARVLTINPESYPYRPEEALFVGHGIDYDLFKPDGQTRDPGLLLSVARLSPIKDAGTFLRTVERLRSAGHPVNARWVGQPPDRDRGYSSSIDQLQEDLALEDVVTFGGAVPNGDLPAWYCRSGAHVNLCPTGALDKAPLEAMGCGTPTFVANEGFRPLLGAWSDLLLFRHGDPVDLAHRVVRLRMLNEDVRRRLSADLRRAAMKQHGLAQLRDRLVAIFQTEIDRARGTREKPFGRRTGP